MKLFQIATNTANNTDAFVEAAKLGRPYVLRTLMGPAFRGLLLQRAKNEAISHVTASHEASLNWSYRGDKPELRRLYDIAKASQWDAAKAVDWTTNVDPHDPSREILMEHI